VDRGYAVANGARLEAFRRLTLERALAEISQLLTSRGARPLLLKGPAFARWLYEDPSERPYGDIDLLVAPDRLETAARGLSDLGYQQLDTERRLSERAEHHERWIRRGSIGVVVELHRTLGIVDAAPSLVWERLSDAARSIEVSGADVDVPSDAASALIVALHAAQHGAGARRPLDDLDRALRIVDEPTWRTAAAVADALGSGPAFAAGLRLRPRGREFARRLGLSEESSRWVRLQTSTAGEAALGIERLIVTPGIRARARLLAAELVPSRQFMRAGYPLARRGFPGLVAAYLWRPFSLAGKLPRGVWRWTRAASPRRYEPPEGA
jgi:hypothetical protein